MAKRTMQQIEDAALHSRTYLDALNSIARQRADLVAQQTSDKQTHDVEYAKTLRQLGYNPTSNTWDYGSQKYSPTTSAKAFNSLSNDFAARNMLDSGAYAAMSKALSNSLIDQYNTQQAGDVAFNANQKTALRNFDTVTAEQQRQAARQQALNNEMSRILGGS